MRILVCGGRYYNNRDLVFAALDTIHQKWGDITIIHGCATGADSLADEWADKHAVPCHKFPALWRSFGKSAGPKRNQDMIDIGKPDLFIAFPGGKGTADMIKRCRKAGISGTVIENESENGTTDNGKSHDDRVD